MEANGQLHVLSADSGDVTSGIQKVGESMGLQASLDSVDKVKMFALLRIKCQFIIWSALV